MLVESRGKSIPTFTVSIHWNDGNYDDFPGVWLRDNCQCPKCYSKEAGNRILLMENLDANVKPEKVCVSEESDVCKIKYIIVNAVF